MTTTVHLDPIAAGVKITRTNSHWGPTLGAATGPITFGFRATPPAYDASIAPTFSTLTAAEMTAVETALRLWSNVANISFSEVNAGGTTDNATMLFGNYSSTTDASQAYAYFPGSTAASSAAGDVWLNTNYESTTSLPAGSYDMLTLIHEIGHTFGLSHPGSYNAAPGVSITYANNAEYVEDSRQYSVMSYFGASNTGANHVYNGQTIQASTPLLDDITAIQRLYGANTSFAAGNTVYGFNSNADAAYHLTSGTQQIVCCIWDGGGNDTLDFSGYANNQVINLNQGAFSDIGALTKNVSIAIGTVIENAVGGSGNDTMYGNDAGDKLDGGAGNDIIYGGAGNDLLIGGTGLNQLWGGAGTDTASYEGTAGKVYATLAGLGGYVDSGAGLVLTDTYNSIENLTGGAGDDTLVGDAGGNLLTGGAGSDALYGGDGNDTLVGGAAGPGGINQLWGGNGSDTASYAGTTGKVYASIEDLHAYVDSGAGYVLTDAYNSIENLLGGSGSDILIGDAGNNVIEGGAGADQLYGRGGANTFVYRGYADSNVVAGYDTIADFKAGIDRIDLTSFHTDAAHVQLVFGAASTKLRVEVTAGVFNAATDLAVNLIGANALSAADILF